MRLVYSENYQKAGVPGCGQERNPAPPGASNGVTRSTVCPVEMRTILLGVQGSREYRTKSKVLKSRSLIGGAGVECWQNTITKPEIARRCASSRSVGRQQAAFESTRGLFPDYPSTYPSQWPARDTRPADSSQASPTGPTTRRARASQSWAGTPKSRGGQ